MFEKFRSVVTNYRYIRYQCPKINGAERKNVFDTIYNVSRLCINKLNVHSEGLKPFVRQCSRQVDYVAAQKLKRGQQWIRFYTQLWSRDKLSTLFKQMGRRLGIALRYRRISTLVFSGAAFAPVKNNFEENNADEKIKPQRLNDNNQKKLPKRYVRNPLSRLN